LLKLKAKLLVLSNPKPAALEFKPVAAKSDIWAFQWHGGVISRVNGAIYGFPAHADSVLKIQPETGEVSTIGDCRLEGFRCGCLRFGHGGRLHGGTLLNTTPPCPDRCRYKWLGGIIDPVSQCIYCIPSNADCVLKIDPHTDTVTTFGQLSRRKNKWQVGFFRDSAAATSAVTSAMAPRS
jgi:hypothetical protein